MNHHPRFKAAIHFVMCQLVTLRETALPVFKHKQSKFQDSEGSSWDVRIALQTGFNSGETHILQN